MFNNLFYVKTMKRTVFILFTLLGVATTQADDYPYLTFQTSDGTEQSIASSALVFTFADGKLKATNGINSLEIALTDLNKMYFNTEATGIEETTIREKEEEVEAFSLAGIPMGKYENIEQARHALPKGIYVVKGASKTLKIAVK